MKWFEGQIAAAISRAKQQKSLFVVYISGTNDDSEKMDKSWEDGEVAKTCEEADLVVMKFQANSDECKQFSVFYPVICVPCVYLISGESGTLLESVAGFAASSDLIQKIKKVVETLKQGQAMSPPQQQQPQQQVAATPQAPVAVSQSEPAVKAQTTPTVEAGSASTVMAPAAASSSSSSSSETQKESAHERAARMRQKMEEVHRKKEQQRKEVDKQQEMERRKSGQLIQKVDQQRSDQQARQAADDIRKQRLEDKVAREKVLLQLARDKADKEARFRTEKEKREQQKLRVQQEKEAAEKEETSRKAEVKMDTAMIQFRLPDGSTMTNQFASAAPLQEALDLVTEKFGANLKEFTLSTTYPRRNFGPDDMQMSFLDHGLVPRAAIVILPGRLIPTSSRQSSQRAPSSSSDGDGGVFSWFLAPFLFIYNFIYSLVFGVPSVTSPAAAAAAQSPQSAGATSQPPQSSGEEDSPAVERNFRSAGARPKSSYARRRAPATGGNADNFSRQEGNVHRLNTQQADNDENNTWNGNSTQQM